MKYINWILANSGGRVEVPKPVPMDCLYWDQPLPDLSEFPKYNYSVYDLETTLVYRNYLDEIMGEPFCRSQQNGISPMILDLSSRVEQENSSYYTCKIHFVYPTKFDLVSPTWDKSRVVFSVYRHNLLLTSDN